MTISLDSEDLKRVEEQRQAAVEINSLGPLGQHEILDRTAIIVQLVDALLLSHPTLADNSEWYKLAQLASKALAHLYIAIGAKENE